MFVVLHTGLGDRIRHFALIDWDHPVHDPVVVVRFVAGRG